MDFYAEESEEETDRDLKCPKCGSLLEMCGDCYKVFCPECDKGSGQFHGVWLCSDCNAG